MASTSPPLFPSLDSSLSKDELQTCFNNFLIEERKFVTSRLEGVVDQYINRTKQMVSMLLSSLESTSPGGATATPPQSSSSSSSTPLSSTASSLSSLTEVDSPQLQSNSKKSGEKHSSGSKERTGRKKGSGNRKIKAVMTQQLSMSSFEPSSSTSEKDNDEPPSGECTRKRRGSSGATPIGRSGSDYAMFHSPRSSPPRAIAASHSATSSPIFAARKKKPRSSFIKTRFSDVLQGEEDDTDYSHALINIQKEGSIQTRRPKDRSSLLTQQWKTRWLVASKWGIACYSNKEKDSIAFASDWKGVQVLGFKPENEIEALSSLGDGWKGEEECGVPAFLVISGKKHWSGHIKFTNQASQADWLITLNGIRAWSQTSLLHTAIHRALVVGLFLTPMRGGIVKGPNDQEWECKQNSIEFTAAPAASSFQWDGSYFRPSHGDVRPRGYGFWDGISLIWKDGNKELVRYFYDQAKEEFQFNGIADDPRNWRRTKTVFLASTSGVGEWITEGSVTFCIPMFLQITNDINNAG